MAGTLISERKYDTVETYGWSIRYNIFKCMNAVNVFGVSIFEGV